MPTDRVDDGRRQALTHRMGANVDQREPRRRRLIFPTGQRKPPVAAADQVLQGFKGGRGRSEHYRNAVLLRTYHSQIARRITAAAIVLFVGAVVLLVDHDPSE